MSMALDRFCFRVLLANLLSVVLSTFILVGGCGYTISNIVVRSGTASYAFIYDALTSASAASAVTFVIIFHTL